MDLRRGEVILVSFPYITAPSKRKHRPAVIIQNDIGNQYSPNLIVAAISSRTLERAYPTNYLLKATTREAQQAGLTRDSVVHAEVILTLSKRAVIRRLGRLSKEVMEKIDECLRISLAL